MKNFVQFVEESKDADIDRKEKKGYTFRDYTLDIIDDF